MAVGHAWAERALLPERVASGYLGLSYSIRLQAQYIQRDAEGERLLPLTASDWHELSRFYTTLLFIVENRFVKSAARGFCVIKD